MFHPSHRGNRFLFKKVLPTTELGGKNDSQTKFHLKNPFPISFWKVQFRPPPKQKKLNHLFSPPPPKSCYSSKFIFQKAFLGSHLSLKFFAAESCCPSRRFESRFFRCDFSGVLGSSHTSSQGVWRKPRVDV